jgi:predicted chitinase
MVSTPLRVAAFLAQINGGLNGQDDRLAFYAQAKQALGIESK